MRWSAQIHTKFHVHRITQEFPRRAPVFGYGPFTLSGAIFHSLHLIVALPQRAPTTPPASWWFGLFRFRSPLLTESLSLSFPPVTEMFHFTGCRDAHAMYSHELDRTLLRSGYPIRKSPGQSVFTALRGLSQLATSFIAYWHQGIHYVLFVA
jgi:hypothetical protein